MVHTLLRQVKETLFKVESKIDDEKLRLMRTELAQEEQVILEEKEKRVGQIILNKMEQMKNNDN